MQSDNFYKKLLYFVKICILNYFSIDIKVVKKSLLKFRNPGF